MGGGKKLTVESLERREVFSATSWALGVATGDFNSDGPLAVEWGAHKAGGGATGQSRATVDSMSTDLAFQSDTAHARHHGIIAVLIGL